MVWYSAGYIALIQLAHSELITLCCLLDAAVVASDIANQQVVQQSQAHLNGSMWMCRCGSLPCNFAVLHSWLLVNACYSGMLGPPCLELAAVPSVQLPYSRCRTADLKCVPLTSLTDQCGLVIFYSEGFGVQVHACHKRMVDQWPKFSSSSAAGQVGAAAAAGWCSSSSSSRAGWCLIHLAAWASRGKVAGLTTAVRPSFHHLTAAQP